MAARPSDVPRHDTFKFLADMHYTGEGGGSTLIPVRLVVAAALVASYAWLAYLARRLFERR